MQRGLIARSRVPGSFRSPQDTNATLAFSTANHELLPVSFGAGQAVDKTIAIGETGGGLL
jgi:hypothetical protein